MTAGFLLILSFLKAASACTNFMVAPGASVDGATLMSYSCDGPPFGSLTHHPAQVHPNGTSKCKLTRAGCTEVGPFRGEIELKGGTYNVIGLINEHAVSIGETTFGGNVTLNGTGLLAYPDVMEIALQRSRTAREMIRVMDALVREYGYGGNPTVFTEAWGTGESFTIADPEEVWHMEMIGKGKFDKGAVWVAMRVPDGHVGGHANQARITTFPLNDAENCMYSDDVIDFAVKIGLYRADAPKEQFSFADAYDPISFAGARACDARVWSFFSQVAEPGFEQRYESYAMGRNLTDRMPLFVKAAKKIAITDFFTYMRNHYENTALDDRQDIGAGPFHSVFRNRPSMWRSGGHLYTNERHVGVPYAGAHYVAQLRGWLPRPLGGVNWFSVDDATFSAHVPFHGSCTRVPWAYANGNGAADRMSFESAFWVFNMVANFAYYRYSEVAPLVAQKVAEYEQRFMDAVVVEDRMALQMWKANQTAAVELLTSAAEKRANELVRDWLAFYQKLFMSFRDGAVPPGMSPGYSEDWYDRIAKETGTKYLVPDSLDTDINMQKTRVLDRMRETPNSLGSRLYEAVV